MDSRFHGRGLAIVLLAISLLYGYNVLLPDMAPQRTYPSMYSGSYVVRPAFFEFQTLLLIYCGMCVLAILVSLLFRWWLLLESVTTAPDGMYFHRGEDCSWFLPWGEITKITRGRASPRSDTGVEDCYLVVDNTMGESKLITVSTLFGNMPNLNEFLVDVQNRGVPYRVLTANYMTSDLRD